MGGARFLVLLLVLNVAVTSYMLYTIYRLRRDMDVLHEALQLTVGIVKNAKKLQGGVASWFRDQIQM